MEQESLSDQQTATNKKGRQRKKQLYSSILRLMEFYFSDANLSKDRFLSQLLETDSTVDLNIFLKFNKIRRLTSNVDDIAKSIKKSSVLTLSADSLKVSRVNPIRTKHNIDQCTIYVENIKSDTTHDWLINLFSDFGKVDYVSIPKFRQNKVNKGFAFVEFSAEDGAGAAVQYFEEIGAKMSSKIAPECLKSIATFEPDENITEKDDLVVETSVKRKLTDVDVKEEPVKKLKLEESREIDAETKKKRHKSKKSKKKSVIKELGLQVLPKHEWKKLRNQYLDMQKKKMKQLKVHLNKRKFANKYDSRLKLTETPPRLHDAQFVVENVPAEEEKLQFMQGVIVKLKLFDITLDAKKIKSDLKSRSCGIEYVDLPHEAGNTAIYIRFVDTDRANTFLTDTVHNIGAGELLAGDDEHAYWTKIKEDRAYRLKKGQTKGRGREKLLKKAERELGKHIRFDDNDAHD